ncbi:MAG: FKBP-type peptidyl-prolyl cis-trans isomerase [Tannerella sp.]|jgi:FKBP-type peptidyl-prolyl cis-trans isomerase FklB|nr:FKBP-type peptidyl-prolyl cis-trans isomerase [Tannerella sp.]
MKRISILIVSAALLSAGSCKMFRKTELKSEIDTMSYYFGMSRAEGIKNYLQNQAGVDTSHIDAFYKGLQYGSKHYSPEDVAYLEGMRIAQLINNQWVNSLNREVFAGDSGYTVNRAAILAGFYHGVKQTNDLQMIHAQSYSQGKIEKFKNEFKQQKYADKIAANLKFLADNKGRQGVVATASGLQYEIITAGEGQKPESTSSVKVNYRGTLIDGTEFDSSYKTDKPAQFRVNQVIKGWTEALLMMPAGSKWKLYIPQELGYGSNEQGNIPPYSTLIFEVELVSIDN